MDLNHAFTVEVPVEDAWRILTDVERIAPCLPGAQLQEIEGDTYRGAVKVKVGPIQAQFKGQASFVDLDDVAHKVVLKGEGRDIGGKGNASALITAELTSLTATSTSVTVNTDLSVTGKVAQFGRGAMADISDKQPLQHQHQLLRHPLQHLPLHPRHQQNLHSPPCARLMAQKQKHSTCCRLAVASS